MRNVNGDQHMLQTSILNRVYPTAWKETFIIPAPKTDHLIKNNVPPKLQFGKKAVVSPTNTVAFT